MSELEAVRIFTERDQQFFAELSGDWNPMHMDPVAARRTQAGAPVVHGIHLLLWSLENLIDTIPEGRSIAELKVRFSSMVYVGDEVELRISNLSEKGASIDLCTHGVTASRFQIKFGEPPAPVDAVDARESNRLEPVALPFEEVEGQEGVIPASSGAMSEAFPKLSRGWSAGRVQTLLTTTALVGMVCPGRDSIFGALNVAATNEGESIGGLSYRVTSVDPRFRLVRMEVAGAGVRGTVDAFARKPPVDQPSMSDLKGKIAEDAFRGTRVLVVGGSRGLGELAAKLLATGGAEVVVTYSVGKKDAERVVAEIAGAGGNCRSIRYDVKDAAATQLESMSGRISHVFYFATPQIFHKKSEIFSFERFEELGRFYLAGFYELVKCLRERSEQLTVFYPSTAFVAARPEGMTEYAMTKAAGEVLCAEMAERWANVRAVVSRLPRLPTDQTASLQELEMEDPIDVLAKALMSVPSSRDLA